MYTQLHLAVELKKDTPKEVIEMLEWLIDKRKEGEQPQTPNHSFFGCERWKWMFWMDSYYFNAPSHSIFKYDDISKQYILFIQSNLKNYNSEIEWFLDWIMPYVDALEGEFLGYHRYEEELKPTLIYYKESQIGRQDKTRS